MAQLSTLNLPSHLHHTKKSGRERALRLASTLKYTQIIAPIVMAVAPVSLEHLMEHAAADSASRPGSHYTTTTTTPTAAQHAPGSSHAPQPNTVIGLGNQAARCVWFGSSFNVGPCKVEMRLGASSPYWTFSVNNGKGKVTCDAGHVVHLRLCIQSKILRSGEHARFFCSPLQFSTCCHRLTTWRKVSM